MDDFCVKALAHELQHAWDTTKGAVQTYGDPDRARTDMYAIRTENLVALWLIGLHPSWYNVPHVYSVQDYMRPGGYSTEEPAPPTPW